MKKHIPYVVALGWMIAVAVLAFLDGLSWSRGRMRSAYLDGCAEGDRIYLVENMEKDAVLYVMDTDGEVQEVSLASSAKKGSVFAKIDYEDSLYGVLTDRASAEESSAARYTIVQFDDQGRVTAQTPEYTMEQKGVLTGFSAESKGFYLTVVLEDETSAGAYFVDKEQFGREDDTEAVSLKPVQMAYGPKGRTLVEARYENGDFFFRLDDGTGIEHFQASEKLQSAFWYRNLSIGQIVKVRHGRMLLYGALLIAGYAVLLFFLTVLRNRSHTVYTIALVELVLFVITVAGAVQIPQIQEKARVEEAGRFGSYYVQALAEEMGNPAGLRPEEEGFYDSDGYRRLQERFDRFVHLDDLSVLFTDLCLVRSRDHRIVVSVSGYNGQMFEEIYGVGTKEMVSALAEEGRRGSMLIGIGAETYQVIAVAASDGLTPDYMMMGITRRKDLSRTAGSGQAAPFLYAALVFLAGSAASIWLLLLQGRELKDLAAAMQMLANGDTGIKKTAVHGKDVDFMWNSLMETRKTISRINYAKYRIFESCYRFAPKNIEKILGKDSITEVNSGDKVLLHGTMAVISSVRSEETGQVQAERIGAFVSLVEEHQERSGGYFVSGHCGLDMMKVLFLEESRNTVEFGVSLMQGFLEQNLPGTKKAGILLHHAQYMYGVAGTKKHSIPYLLSPEMEELEQYGRWFQSLNIHLVITESVKNRENLDSPVRYLGYLLLSGSKERIRLYEVLDACPLLEGKRKAGTDEKFQKGIRLFYQHDFYLARSAFNDVRRENPEDSMATWYLFTCEKYLNEANIKGDVCRLSPRSSPAED